MAHGKGRKLYDLYKATETPREWFSELFIHAREIGIEIFSSVFSSEDVDFLEQFNPPAYKIASFRTDDEHRPQLAARVTSDVAWPRPGTAPRVP
jgi:sialic acid synthase SpsE